jgi:hypothetical protein
VWPARRDRCCAPWFSSAVVASGRAHLDRSRFVGAKRLTDRRGGSHNGAPQSAAGKHRSRRLGARWLAEAGPGTSTPLSFRLAATCAGLVCLGRRPLQPRDSPRSIGRGEPLREATSNPWSHATVAVGRTWLGRRLRSGSSSSHRLLLTAGCGSSGGPSPGSWRVDRAPHGGHDGVPGDFAGCSSRAEAWARVFDLSARDLGAVRFRQPLTSVLVVIVAPWRTGEPCTAWGRSRMLPLGTGSCRSKVFLGILIVTGASS